jgi:death-on-curing protein
MKMTSYLTLDELLRLHERLLERDGGSAGVRDLGLVEAALARPRSGYYATLAAQAAALLQSLVTGHAFVDGNKHVGFAACAVFLIMNGHRVSVSADVAEAFLITQVIGNHADVDAIAAWLEARMTPVAKANPKAKKR